MSEHDHLKDLNGLGGRLDRALQDQRRELEGKIDRAYERGRKDLDDLEEDFQEHQRAVEQRFDSLENTRSRSSGGWAAVAAAFAVILAIAGLLFSILQNKSGTPTPTPTATATVTVTANPRPVVFNPPIVPTPSVRVVVLFSPSSSTPSPTPRPSPFPTPSPPPTPPGTICVLMLPCLLI